MRFKRNQFNSRNFVNICSIDCANFDDSADHSQVVTVININYAYYAVNCAFVNAS